MAGPFTPQNGALYRNPQGTLPMPSAGNNIPVAYYQSTKLPLAWKYNPADDLHQAVWQTPVFNLRPDLRSAGGSPKTGVPIWSSTARLYVQVSNLVNGSTLTTQGLRVDALEQASIAYGDVRTGFTSVENVTAPVDVTSDIMLGISQPDRIVLVFAPLGEAYPVRFWSVRLVFQKDPSDWASNQIIYVESAYY
jgi:hypothetical protein